MKNMSLEIFLRLWLDILKSIIIIQLSLEGTFDLLDKNLFVSVNNRKHVFSFSR